MEHRNLGESGIEVPAGGLGTWQVLDDDVSYAQPYLGKEYISPDGVHPNDNGYEVIADQLRKLGYSPLSLRL